jgi:copper chaperone CopZ/transcriptional regulator with XRE-family HTH domain
MSVLTTYHVTGMTCGHCVSAVSTEVGRLSGVTKVDVNLSTGEVQIRHQVMRVKGEGLVLVGTKSAAGERLLKLPRWCEEILEARRARGVHLTEPVFCDALGGFRDPNNVRRDLRRARAPHGSTARQGLGASLARARRSAKLSRQEVAQAFDWPRSRVELVEAGRVRAEVDTAAALADLYGVTAAERSELLSQAKEASQPEAADALAWITSHSFRKTTATILDEAGQSARQIADQLGHARPSMTQDVYMGRRAKNPGAAAALDSALNREPESKPEGFPEGSRVPRDEPDV